MANRYGLAVETQGHFYRVTRFGHGFWAKAYNTKATARKWMTRAKVECQIDPLAGIHFAPAHVRRVALAALGIASKREG